MLRDSTIQGRGDRFTGHTFGYLQNRTPATPLINDGEYTKRSTID